MEPAGIDSYMFDSEGEDTVAKSGADIIEDWVDILYGIRQSMILSTMLMDNPEATQTTDIYAPLKMWAMDLKMVADAIGGEYYERLRDALDREEENNGKANS